ncbi:NAD(P)/FAD-dependent oxidoreductase [Streptomyces sp. CA-253872]|uniref:NAD(P)/FAD-dependent oxidoreductase n=1 Tax=Streptomyces sp. CA-253872 TaxID=3240067 RepID=UPI003D8AD774
MTAARGPLPRRIVVAGHGIAGLTAAGALREAGFDGELTLVGDEPHAPYSRPALSKALLGGADPGAHTLPPGEHGARELRGVRVTALDPVRRRVALDDGASLPYDALVLATGARARRLSPGGGEWTLRGLDDALALRRALAARPSVLVVGGGVLGMEIASGALAAGCAVTLVSYGPPLRARLGPHLAGVLVRAARAWGLRLVETAARARLDAGRVRLADGTAHAADLVVSAVGDVPHTEWLAGTGLTADDGSVPVDAHGLARPGIAAVGDLAALPAPGGHRRVPLWNSAVDQALTAAHALLHGLSAPPLARPYFWTEQFGRGLKVAGPLPPAGEPEYVAGGPGGGPALLRWPRSGTAAALDHRLAVPRLRRLAAGGA